MITCFLVDDEKQSRDLLNTLLRDYCTGVEVIGQSGNVQESIQLITSLKPQLVFLDIQLSGENAFDLLDTLPNRTFEVIFTTGYEQYALKAIKYSGIDYLLKPIDLEELKEAISRAVAILRSKMEPVEIAVPEKQADLVSGRVVVPTHQGYIVLDSRMVVYLEAEGAYTRFYLNDGNSILACSRIGVFEDRLPDMAFVRIHRSYLVNLTFVQEYIRGRGGYIRLKNGDHLNVSIRKKPTLLQALGL